MLQVEQRKLIGALLLVAALGSVGWAILGPGGGAVCAVLIFIALVVAQNL